MFDRSLAMAICLCWLLFPAFARCQHIDAPDSESLKRSGAASTNKRGPDLSTVARLIIEKTNRFRQQENRPSLTVNVDLVKAADYFAHYMAKTNKFGHTADGNQPADRVKKYGYDYCIVAENVAYEFSSAGFADQDLAEKLFEGWKHSPEHRKNMLDPDVSEIGVAVARSEETQYFYAVQDFGRPKSRAITFQITNDADETVHYEIAGRQFTLPSQYTRTHERCRPEELSVSLPNKEKEQPANTKKLRPANGDHFAITSESGSYQVIRK